MNKYISISFYLVLVMTFLVSCSGSTTTDNTEVAAIDADEELVSEEVACSPQDQHGFLGFITTSSIGIVNLGSKLPNLDEHIEYEIQSIKQIVPQTEGDEKYQTVHHLYYNMTEVMLLEMEESNTDIIKSITTYSTNYYLKNCIRVGVDFSEIVENYNEIDVMLNYDDGMLYGAVVEQPGIRFVMTPDNILDPKKVNEIDGHTSVDNINPNGKIMSIIVQN